MLTYDEIHAHLERHVIAPWFPRSLDEEEGGFLCEFTRAWKEEGRQPKLIEFQARQTLFAAEAYQMFPEDERLRRAAHHGFDCLRGTLWDADSGGWYHRVKRDGQLLEAGTKHAHGAAYAIQACVAVHGALGIPAALDLARLGFEWLERCSHDSEHGGYFGFQRRDGTRIREAFQCPWSATNDTIGTPIGLKDLNVHSDLLEALSYLYRARANPLVEERLAELMALLGNRMFAGNSHMKEFYQPNWEPANDVVNFGHSFQTVFRLLLAGAFTGRTEQVKGPASRLMDYLLEHAYDRRNGGYLLAVPARRREKVWWVQTEALKALLAMKELDPENSTYREKFDEHYGYIQRRFLDPQYGGMYPVGLDTFAPWRRGLGLGLIPSSAMRKGFGWKDASHDGRAWLYCLSVLRKLEQNPLEKTGTL